MLLGNVSQAMKFVKNEDSTRGVHPLSDEIKQLFEEKHTKVRDFHQDILIPPTGNSELEPIIYEEINGLSVCKAAKTLQGSRGPTLIDADGRKHFRAPVVLLL